MLDAILNLATQPRVLNIASHQSRHGTSCYYDGLRHFSVALKTKKRADHRISTAAIISKKSIQSVDDVDDEMSRVSVQLIPIVSQQQFNQITHDSQDAILILWMATWCRKCIYLKPKLEKLAADYFPRLRFYCVDVNAVPHKLVTLADVSKMPTIQVWKDKKKHGEVIGGHKAYLVVNEIREMIDNTYGGSQ